MRITVLLFCVWGLTINAWGQQVFRGHVVDEKGEAIAYALISLPEVEKFGTTEPDGSFSLKQIPEGSFTLVVSHVGYDKYTEEVTFPVDEKKTIQLNQKYLMIDQILVESTRADDNTPTTYSNLSKEDIERGNFGQDIPMLLDLTPSVTVTSDAGGGIGYTGIRIRGSDMTRINVTINGIPVNDSESHGVYWVNTPDLLSSTENIQIQRGVGTSTNGPGAFGATINLMTDQLRDSAYGIVSMGGGSYHTRKLSLRFGTGLIKNKWTFDGRLSGIQSDGYIDRAFADLKSYYFSAGYNGKKTTVKAITFAGKEITSQAWWGTPEARLMDDVEGMNFVADMNGYSDEQRDNLLTSGRTFNYYLYENEVDNYAQDHYQLHFSQAVSEKVTAYGALHYTYGRGFYEQYRTGDDFINYDIDEIITTGGPINTTDLIRRRWLDNHFYGLTYSIQHVGKKTNILWGGAMSKYKGEHFGEVIWSQYAVNIPHKYRYYDNNAEKFDFNTYVKVTQNLTEDFIFFGDLQYRRVDYSALGPDNDRVNGIPNFIDVDQTYDFFNPKFGFSYFLKESKLYFSFATANREPVRTDFIDNQLGTVPGSETMINWEAGGVFKFLFGQLGLNAYYMDYKDQLVLTGEINDVGSPIRVNVPDSYRAGLEAQASVQLNRLFDVRADITLSRNKILGFTETIYNYGVDWSGYSIEQIDYDKTNIAFSPSIISSGAFIYNPVKNFDISLLTKFVGQQYLDNTSSLSRRIDPYFLTNTRVNYSLKTSFISTIDFGLLINNIFNVKYASNGYTFGYKGGGMEIRENYFYPQAERNFLISMALTF